MTSAHSAPRPDEWQADVVLADGSTAHVRPISADDGDALVALHSRLSPSTIYYRFFSFHPRLSEKEVARFTQVDYVDRMAFVDVARADDMVAVARYDRMPGSDSAEAAAGPAEYERAIGVLAADPGVDAVLAIFTPPIVTRADEVAVRLPGVGGRRPGQGPRLRTLAGGACRTAS